MRVITTWPRRLALALALVTLVLSGGASAQELCAVDADCDDGDPCNGAETCVDLSCAAGEAWDCSDGIECSIDTCEGVYTGPASLCADLGWSTEGGTDDVCGASQVGAAGACVTGVSWSTANNTCVALGARLCTAAELAADEAADSSPISGCGLDNNRVWASESCSGGHLSQAGASEFLDDLPEECTANGTQLGVRCCTLAVAPPLEPSCKKAPDHDKCSDAHDCTTDTCNVSSGCVFSPVHAECEDSVPCTDNLCSATDGCTFPPNDSYCNDGINCTIGVCDPETDCDSVPDHGFCNDGDPCTEGVCDPTAQPGSGCTQESIAGAPCDDGNLCTDDACVEGQGCVGTPNEAADVCDDGDACTEDEVCADGACTSEPVDCDDDEECTIDSCGPSGCEYENTSVPCTDGNLCTLGDACSGGVCEPGAPKDCEDDHECTQHACTPQKGKCELQSTNDAACTDGVICTVDSCHEEDGCVFVPQDTFCPSDECTASACDPVNDCQFTDTSGDCQDGDECTVDTCDPSLGCEHTPTDEPEGCELPPTCGDLDCDDGNACTVDGCDPEAVLCTHEDLSCEDDHECTEDACDQVLETCVHAANHGLCDDDEACTEDTCDVFSGCSSAPLEGPCDDGSACTTEDMCSGGECSGGPPPDCDDLEACTVDTCDAEEGCVNSPNTGDCDDGHLCTLEDTCAGGACSGQAVVCDDPPADECKEDGLTRVTWSAVGLCDDEITGECIYQPTETLCAGGCTGGKCLSEVCAGAGFGVPCDDQDGCTLADSCDGEGNCVGATLDCSTFDGPCTLGLCQESDSSCTLQILGDGATCEDGDLCTAGETCMAGACDGGASIDCGDDNPCTTESCDPTTGCLAELHEEPCDDGDVCTELDACSEGSCVGVGAACDDGNDCTADACLPGTGCVHAAEDGGTCDDGSVCTLETACVDGECLGTTLDCGDGNDCTKDECNDVAGCVNPPDNQAACDDGDACTSKGFCVNKSCVAGAVADCDDEEPCTDDACDPETGCTNESHTEACDDGDACTEGDACAEGACVGSVIDCDDGNACTDESCDPEVGCASTPNSATCNDGDLCTSGDTCGEGACAGTAIEGCCLSDSDCLETTICELNACEPAQCAPCATSEDCNGGVCEDLATGAFCASYCTDDEGCPEGFVCDLTVFDPEPDGSPDEGLCTPDPSLPTTACFNNIHATTDPCGGLDEILEICSGDCSDADGCCDEGLDEEGGCVGAEPEEDVAQPDAVEPEPGPEEDVFEPEPEEDAAEPSPEPDDAQGDPEGGDGDQPDDAQGDPEGGDGDQPEPTPEDIDDPAPEPEDTGEPEPQPEPQPQPEPSEEDVGPGSLPDTTGPGDVDSEDEGGGKKKKKSGCEGGGEGSTGPLALFLACLFLILRARARQQ